MFIPTISPLSINDNQLDDLMRIGFCYVKLPDENLVITIQACMEIARTFFKCDVKDKERWRLKDTFEDGDQYQGYALRSQSKNTNAIEQIFFEPDAPFGPYEPHSLLIKEINESFMNLIFMPIMSGIFNRLGLAQPGFIEATTKPYRSLVFQSCPSISEDKEVIRLNAHKDFGLVTVLFFEEAGLEVKYQNAWKAIPPQQGCVVVNLGNAIERMTDGRCHSALHRVTNATDNRISMVYFINPNYRQPVRNYIDNTIIAATGEQFFRQQFADYYEVDH